MTTNIGTTSAATLSQSGGLGTIDAAITGITAPAALTSATITGGESPTEAEHNALRADVAMLRIWAAAVHAALIAVG
jgi:hypothetical protein